MARYANATAAPVRDAAEALRLLGEQLTAPVRWVESVQKMADLGVDKLVECGPGKVLIGLNKRINKQMAAAAVFDPDSLTAALTA